MSNNKHFIDLTLISPRIKLRQSDNIILDNQDTKESIADFVCALKRKITNFPDIYYTTLEASQFPPKFACDQQEGQSKLQRKLDPYQNLKRND